MDYRRIQGNLEKYTGEFSINTGDTRGYRRLQGIQENTRE